MPIIHQSTFDDNQLLIWHISEEEEFFHKEAGIISNKIHQKKRLEYLASRWCLKILIPNLNVQTILKGDDGKPYLPDTDIHFSISHSFPYVAVAVSQHHTIGIDIQTKQEKILKLQYKFLNEFEQALCENDIDKITFAWCCKEAMYKKYGLGGLDFKIHMPIAHLVANKETAIAIINFNKNTVAYPQQLSGAIMDDFSWAITIN
jgi:4'-phosphopantetheinyl transferase